MKHFCTHKWIAVLAAIIMVTSCTRKFDAPPLNADPDIAVTMTIMELKARYAAVGDFKRIQDNQTISGVVIADDRSGNFYKQIIIQDATGGISVLLDANNVYTRYPVGRRVFVKLKGMMLGDYGGTIQIGIDTSRSADGRFLNLDGIPQTLFDQYLVKGSFNNTITPKTVRPSDFTKKINDPLLSTLVQIENMEFKDADLNKTYADLSKKTGAVNFTVTTCDKQSIVLRNSSYAKFASIKIPNGNGTLTGVPSIFNGTMQMFIRDTVDVHFTGSRCASMPATPTTIADLRKLYAADMSLDKAYSVGGTVISDGANKNIASGNFILQSGNRAIIVYKGGTIPYSVGDSVVLKLSTADSLINYRNSLELKLEKDYPLPAAIATGKTIAPEVKTIVEINTALGLPLGDPNNFEYALVRVNKASTNSGTFGGGV